MSNYHLVNVGLDEKSMGIEDEDGIADWSTNRFTHVINLREELFHFGRKIWADYIFVSILIFNYLFIFKS